MRETVWLGRISLREAEKRTEQAVRDCKAANHDSILLFEPLSAYRYAHDRDLDSIRDWSRFRNYCHAHDIDIVRTRDGGGLLYQGPGQLVLCPILKVEHDFDPRRYRYLLEKTMMAFLEDLFGVIAFRYHVAQGSQGVWVRHANEYKKIGFLGAHYFYGRGIISRGCAININPDLRPFDLIWPCNLEGVHATSVKDLKPQQAIPDVSKELAMKLSSIFCQTLDETPTDEFVK